MNTLLRKTLCFTLALACCITQTAFAQQSTPTTAPPSSSSSQPTPTAAPIPPQITQAKTIFISNGGADSFFTLYSGGLNRAYNNLYAELKHWGKYRIVTSPAQADLILEVRSLAPVSDVSGVNGTVDSADSPQIRLQAIDPATHTVLWTLTSYVHAGIGLQKTRNKQFDQASLALVNQLRQLTGETLTPAESRATNSTPGPSRGTKILFVSLLAGGLLASGLLAYHFANQPKPTLPATTTPCGNPPFCTIP